MARDAIQRTTRIPSSLNRELEEHLRGRYYPSANQFIVEAIREKLLRERKR